MTSVQVEQLTEVTEEAADALAELLPQLSSSNPELNRATLPQFVGHEANTVLLARVDGKIVGALTLVMFPLMTGVRAWIEDVVVDASARGAGVGKALTVEAVNLAQARGARTIDLTSRPARQAAHRLYEGVGFRVRDTAVYRYQG
jgi:ribosomal protein S18 acetylase RimI-like enzyme